MSSTNSNSPSNAINAKNLINAINVNKSIAQRVASNFGWSVVSEAIGKGVFFFTNIYLARTLGVSNYGLFTLAQTITYYFWLGVDLGTNMYGIREIAKDKENAESIVNTLLTIRLAAGTIIFTLYAFFLFLYNMPILYKLTFVGCGLYLLTYAFYTDWVLKGLEKFRLIAFGSFVSSLTFLIGILILVKNKDHVIIASVIWSISFLIGGISLFFVLYKKLNIKYKPSFQLKIWLLHLKESIHFTIAGGLSIAYQYLPILLLGILFSKHDIGIFSVSYRTISSFSAPGFLVATALYPTVSELYYKDKKEFKRTGKNFLILMLALGLPVGFLGFIFGDKIILILFGSKYMDSIIIFRILIWLIPLQFIRYKYSTSLRSTEYQKLQFIPIIIGLITLSIFVLIFPKKLKYLAVASTLAEFSLVIGYIGISKMTYNRKSFF